MFVYDLSRGAELYKMKTTCVLESKYFMQKVRCNSTQHITSNRIDSGISAVDSVQIKEAR